MSDYAFKFPKDLYTDVRIEDTYETKIEYLCGNISDFRVRSNLGAFIRIFDGLRWYYSSVSDIDRIQDEIYSLSCLAKPDKNIYKNPTVMNFQVNTGDFIKFSNHDITNIPIDEKDKFLKWYFPFIYKRRLINMWGANYTDWKIIKSFYSSKGARIVFDSQWAGMELSFNFTYMNRNFSEKFQKQSSMYCDFRHNEKELEKFLNKCERFLINSKKVEPGEYTVILSPFAAGVFAHESFGHKSEADFMIGDEVMKEEWSLGKRVGSDILNIVDDGNYRGSWFVPFDDEGTKAEKSYLIRDGILTGRLHSVSTATLLNEKATGNARALNYNFEPIVRMTSTFILPGNNKKRQLLSETEDGIYVETVKSGSGRSTFTLTPSMAYTIKNGRLAEPVNISVITGNVFETLGKVDAVSDKLCICSFVSGGCGKMEQYPLTVKFGGPCIRVKGMDVR